MRGRYVDNKISAIDIAANLPVFFYPRPTTSHLGSISEFHNFRPNLTNEFRLAFNRYNDNITVPNFKYPGLDVVPEHPDSDDLNVQIGPNPNGPQATIQTTYQIIDNVSWIKGKHDFKFGFDGRSLIAASTFIQRVRGDYEYNHAGALPAGQGSRRPRRSATSAASRTPATTSRSTSLPTTTGRSPAT